MYNNQQNKQPYQHKPGRGSFFTNDKKNKPNDPTFKGSAKLPDGTDVWLSVWPELDQNGYPKQNGQHSVSIQPKDAPSGYAGNPAPQNNYSQQGGGYINAAAQQPIQY